VRRKAAEENTSVSPLVGQIRLTHEYRQAYGEWQKVGGLPGMSPTASAAKRHMSVIEKVFVDTSALRYSCDPRDPTKKTAANQWLTPPKRRGESNKQHPPGRGTLP
jgi:hypothetical protein